jgi:flagellar protein FliS
MKAFSKSAYVQNHFTSMSPARVVLALYDGVLVNIQKAVASLEDSDLSSQGEAVSKALQIVAELQASLNLKDGGEVGAALFRLYDYVTMELVRSNVHDDRDGLMMCGSLIQEVRDGWAEMMQSPEANQALNKTNSGYV